MSGTTGSAAALARTITDAAGRCAVAPASTLRAAAEQARDQLLQQTEQMRREGKPRTAWEIERAMRPLVQALEGGAS